MADFEYSALCPAGFEGELANELRSLGCKGVRPLKGSVVFRGELASAYHACLWSRLSSRILMVLARVEAADADALFTAVTRMRWEDHIAPGATLAVEARGGADGMRDTRYLTLMIKDAICDRIRMMRDARPDIDRDNPDVRVVVNVRPHKSTVSLDLGGGSLIDHGYRVPARKRAHGAQSTFLREDMASLMLTLANWHKVCRRGEANLVDPLGTSAALAMEAACIAADRAPGLSRRHWGFTGWSGHDAAAWEAELSAAEARFSEGRKRPVHVIVAASDAGVRDELCSMASRANLTHMMDVRPVLPASLDLGSAPLPNPLVALVMPNAEGADVLGDLPSRMAALAALVRTPALAEAPVVGLTTSDLLDYSLGIQPDAWCNVIDGNGDAVINVYPSAATDARRKLDGDAPEGAVEGAAVLGEDAQSPLTTICLPGGGELAVLVAGSDQFANRLHKVARLRAKWARRTGVTCYRVYDADLPDYAVAIDLYQGCAATPGSWVIVSEYAAPREVDPGLAARRLADVLSITPHVLGIDPSDVFLKVRKRSKGGSQYAEQGNRAVCPLVEENGLIFELNLSDRLDTGLFLDHRDTRALLRTMASGTRFLNLFAYTGSATCYAADGGARQTTTVDLSNTYLDWARRNMEQNGFSGPDHEFIQADVMPWVSEQRRTPNRWDLIFIDPPTFSNSSRMRKKGFDVQDDHVELLIGASRLLTRGGTIVFSCNLRGFEPDVEALRKAGVTIEDISARTIPEDFSRNQRIHKCYLVRREG